MWVLQVAETQDNNKVAREALKPGVTDVYKQNMQSEAVPGFLHLGPLARLALGRVYLAAL